MVVVKAMCMTARAGGCDHDPAEKGSQDSDTTWRICSHGRRYQLSNEPSYTESLCPKRMTMLAYDSCRLVRESLVARFFSLVDRPDGGGIRGLSTLLILRTIMHRIKTEEDMEKVPYPCDYFDLIGGTSTGG